MDQTFDSVIIGGGPAGLTAATYLARFRRKTLVIDRGGSRAALIPTSHNYPGFPDGVGGKEMLGRLRQQAETYGATITEGNVEMLQKADNGWHVLGDKIDVFARTVLFATGVDNRQPDISAEVHAAALTAGKLRYCPICDGYEAGGTASDARIGVLGTDSRGVAEALFLRHYSSNVTLFTVRMCQLNAEHRAQLERAGIAWDPRPVTRYDFSGDAVRLEFADGSFTVIDTLYPALGSQPNIELVRQLGITVDEENCILTDKRQRLGLQGLYAAGDVVSALDQIAVALGHAAIAATAMHNDMREIDGDTSAS